MKRIDLLLTLLLSINLLQAKPAHQFMQKSKEEEMMNTTRTNKEVIHELYTNVLNQRNIELLQNYISDEYVGANGIKGAEGFKAPVLALINAFPDIQWKLERILAEDNKVFVKWTIVGTHAAPFQELAPTGRKISNNGMAIYELKAGKIVKAEILTDRLGFLEALSVLPTDIALLKKQDENSQIRFIDKFVIPVEAEKEFVNRMNINRAFIRKLPGFIEDTAYKSTDQNGNLLYITIAQWENEKVLENAKEAVQAEYIRQGFDPKEMFKRLNIHMERGIYQQVLSQ